MTTITLHVTPPVSLSPEAIPLLAQIALANTAEDTLHLRTIIQESGLPNQDQVHLYIAVTQREEYLELQGHVHSLFRVVGHYLRTNKRSDPLDPTHPIDYVAVTKVRDYLQRAMLRLLSETPPHKRT